jgi:hypothetical protein
MEIASVIKLCRYHIRIRPEKQGGEGYACLRQNGLPDKHKKNYNEFKTNRFNRECVKTG